jgi:glutamine synthetase
LPAGALDGIAAGKDPGAPVEGNGYRVGAGGRLPRSWLAAIERFDNSAFVKGPMGARPHQAFVAVKRTEWEQLAHEVAEAEWALYGFVV